MTVTLEKIYEQFEREERAQRLAAAEPELFCVAAHESGHDLIADRLGLAPEVCIVSAEAGVCIHRKGSPLKNAAVSWGGVMAEALLNAPYKNHTLPKTPLTALTLWKWLDEVNLNELSAEDRNGIEGHDSQYESAKLAFEILSDGLDVLEYLARSRADRAREKFRQAYFRPASVNEGEIQRFIREHHEAQAEKVMEKTLRDAIAKGDEILAHLPSKAPK